MNGQGKHSSNGGPKQADSFTNPEAIEFLNWLRPPPWILVAITPDGPAIGKTVHYAKDADEFVSEYNGKRNIYYSVNPVKNALNKKPRKADIAAIEFLLGDLDPRADEKSEDAKTRYLDQLNGSFQPKPSATVDSGNGIQGLWRLAERILLPADEEQRKSIVADAENRAKALMERLGAEAGTQNIDRILRLPGTINLPNAAKRKVGRESCPTKLIESNGASYPLELFVPGTPDDGGQHARQEEEPASEEQGEGDKLERIIRLGENGEFNGDRSNAVWWVINEMLRRGYITNTIVSTLLDHANKISAHVYSQKGRPPREYAEKQVKEALAKTPRVELEVLPESQWFGEKLVAPPPALIKGLLPQTGVGMLGGQSRVGKTFIALNLACCLIPDCNQYFFIDRYPVKRKGGVIYLVLEGKPAFPLRVTAAFEAMLPNKQLNFGDRYRLPFSWNSFQPNLFEAKGPDALIKLVERDAAKMRQDFGVDPVIVFLDTMGLAACYENENQSAQVQKVISYLDHASDATGAFFMGIDHYGKDQGAGLRGSSAKVAHVETVLAGLVDFDDNDVPSNRRLKLEKIRDGEDGRIIPFRLQKVDMGRDEVGDPVDTCIVKWEPGRPMPLKRGRRKVKTDATLDMAILEVGLPADPEALRAAFYKHHGGSDKAANMAWHRATDGKIELINGKLDYGE